MRNTFNCAFTNETLIGTYSRPYILHETEIRKVGGSFFIILYSDQIRKKNRLLSQAKRTGSLFTPLPFPPLSPTAQLKIFAKNRFLCENIKVYSCEGEGRELMPQVVRCILLAAGYGLYQAASSASYLSAMGTVANNVGFVSQLPFMVASNLVNAAVALLVMILAYKQKLALGHIPQRAGYACIVAAMILGMLFSLGSEGQPPFEFVRGDTFAYAMPIIFGIIRGIGSALITIAWFELFILSSNQYALAVFLGAFTLHALLGLLFNVLPSPATLVLSFACLAASVVCMEIMRKETFAPYSSTPGASPSGLGRETLASAVDLGNQPNTPQFQNIVDFGGNDGRRLLSAVLCMVVCHFVVGITNTAVFNSAFTSVIAGVNVNLCILAAVAAIGAMALLTRKTPDPEPVFRIVMPVLLIIFSIMAIAADAFGPAAGFIMISCYEAIALVYSAYLVTFLANGSYNPYFHVGLTAGISDIMLVLGFGIGVLLNAAWSTHGVPLLTILAFIAIYPLGLAFMYLQQNRARVQQNQLQQEAIAQVKAAQEQAAKDAQELLREEAGGLRSRLEQEFAAKHNLTKRETQVCAYLTRGFTVKSICEELHISENTAWSHIKNVYTKCGVNSKQELIELFEAEVR